MPPKRTPTKAAKSTLAADAAAGTTRSRSTSRETSPPIIPGLSPEFLAFMQQQAKDRRDDIERQDRNRAEDMAKMETIRSKEKATMEAQRKHDLEIMERDRHAQQKAHEHQINLLQEQMKAMSSASKIESSKSPTTKMPQFDLENDKDTYKLWKARWDTHITGHKLDSIPNLSERAARIKLELTAALSDNTLNWLMNSGHDTEDLNDYKFIIKAIEEKIAESTNPLVQQVELSLIIQEEHETGEHLCNRLRAKANRCNFESITNLHDHQLMLALLRAVKPQIRKKMLLKKVTTFDEASAILTAEEQASSDSIQCGPKPEHEMAEAHALSQYRKSQKQERNNYEPKSNERERPEGSKCYRCHQTDHWASSCPDKNSTCGKCKRVGHITRHCRTQTAQGPGSANSITGSANSVSAYLAKQSPIAKEIFINQQIEKAKACGLTFNVQAGKCYNEDQMTEEQREFMITGSLDD